VKAPKIKATQAPAKTAVAIKADVAEPTVLAAGGLPSSEFQSNIRTAVHPGKTKTAKAEKRIILNPQYVLNAKAAELKERGVKLTWASRAWHAGDRGPVPREVNCNPQAPAAPAQGPFCADPPPMSTLPVFV